MCLYIHMDHSSGVRRPKKLWGCVVQPAGPQAAKRSMMPLSFPIRRRGRVGQ
jgi:hypothetical protein